MNNSKQSQKTGFTLIELSIVVVVISLIVAGVVTGQSLVNQSKLRSFVSDMNLIRTSVNTFFQQYNALPGDMTNAYDFWGTAIGCIDAFVQTDGSGCNGDGSRNYHTYKTERQRAWHHLEQADLYNSNLTKASVDTSADLQYVVGVHMPKASVRAGGYRFGSNNTQSYNFIQAGATPIGTGGSSVENNGPMFTANEGI